MGRVLPGLRLIMGALLTASFLVAASKAAAPTLVGKDAPDFVLKSMDGRNLRMSEYRGQVVLVNFWARWAGDSRQEMPALDRINTTYGRAGLVVLGVSIDEDLVRARVRERHESLLSHSVRHRLRHRPGLPAAENAHDDFGRSRGRCAIFRRRLQARRRARLSRSHSRIAARVNP